MYYKIFTYKKRAVQEAWRNQKDIQHMENKMENGRCKPNYINRHINRHIKCE